MVSKSLSLWVGNAKQAGLTAADEEIADWLRKNYSDKYVVLAVNKCESPRKGLMQASDFWSLGWGVSYFSPFLFIYFLLQVFEKSIGLQSNTIYVSVNNVNCLLSISTNWFIQFI